MPDTIINEPDISHLFKEIRHQKKLSQEEIAALLEITQSAWSQMESGKRLPSFDTLAKMHGAGIDVTRLFNAINAQIKPPPLPPIAARVQSDLLRHPDESSKRLAAMVEDRARFGLQKYGVELSCDTDFGDKPPQLYAIEEWLDAAHYSLVCAKRGIAPGVAFWQRAYSDSLQLARVAMSGVEP